MLRNYATTSLRYYLEKTQLYAGQQTYFTVVHCMRAYLTEVKNKSHKVGKDKWKILSFTDLDTIFVGLVKPNTLYSESPKRNCHT